MGDDQATAAYYARSRHLFGARERKDKIVGTIAEPPNTEADLLDREASYRRGFCVANFREPPTGEVRRTPLPRTRVNNGKIQGPRLLDPNPLRCGRSPSEELSHHKRRTRRVRGVRPTASIISVKGVALR